MSTCYRPGCTNERTEGGFCPDCRAAMRTPGRQERTVMEPHYTHCPCGAPVVRDGLCEPCYRREWKRFAR